MNAEGVRKLSLSERELIDQIWKQIQPHMRLQDGKYDQVISWCSFYQNKKFKVEFPLMDKWLQWTIKIVQQVYPGCHILCSGFLKNPANSKKNQIWHTDYGTTVHNIMIPMVDQGCQTATQIIQSPLKTKGQMSPLGYQSHFGYNILDLMDKEGVEFMKVTQIVCRSHTILKLDANTVHRGIANNSSEQRIIYYINVSPEYFELDDEPILISNMNSNDNKQ